MNSARFSIGVSLLALPSRCLDREQGLSCPARSYKEIVCG